MITQGAGQFARAEFHRIFPTVIGFHFRPVVDVPLFETESGMEEFEGQMGLDR